MKTYFNIDSNYNRTGYVDDPEGEGVCGAAGEETSVGLRLGQEEVLDMAFSYLIDFIDELLKDSV